MVNHTTPSQHTLTKTAFRLPSPTGTPTIYPIPYDQSYEHRLTMRREGERKDGENERR